MIGGLEFLRLRRLCSEDTDFIDQAHRMEDFFTKRNYPYDVVHSAFLRVSNISRQQALTPSPNTPSTDRPIISFTYHPNAAPVRNIILSNWSKILQSDPKMAEIYDKPPLFAYKRDRNLRQLLVRSKLSTCTHQFPPGTSPCNNPKCKTCPFVSNCTVLQGPKKSFYIKKHFTCNTENVVYAISCTTCKMIYIGETGRSLSIRFKEHLADTLHHRDKPVANHFNLPNHTTGSMRVQGLWRLMDEDTAKRKERESYLIQLLGTYKPLGINEKM